MGIQEEGLFIFRDLGRKHNFGGFGEQGAEEKHFRELGRNVIFLSGSREQRPPPPGGALVILLFECAIRKCFVVFYVFSFPAGVFVGTLNFIASIPDPSILT